MKPVFQWVYAPKADLNPKTDVKTSSSAISNRIEQAFDSASTTTGTSFDYLVATAQRESSMNPSAKAPTSSAAGLFQFIESTWLETMKQAGPELGLGAIADKIEVDSSGRYKVADAADRKDILALRHDPEIASMMAGALTRRNAETLSSKLGREPSAGELYIAHFLGAGGASRFIGLTESAPDDTAASHFPKQAAANPGIFYEKGTARSMAAVYAELVGQHGDPVAPADDITAMAFAAGDRTGDPATSAMRALDLSVPENRVRAGWGAAEPTDAFAALFRTDHQEVKATAAAAFWQGYARTPGLFDLAVAEDAQQLDGSAAVTPTASAVQPAAKASRRGPLDLARFLDTKS